MPIKISLQNCKIEANNCGGGAIINAIFTMTDAASKNGTATLTGSKNSINAIDHTTFLLIDGNPAVDTIVTPFGNVIVVFAFDAGYNADQNIVVRLDVIDCMGFRNITPAIGYTNALMTHTNEYLSDDNGHYLAFIT